VGVGGRCREEEGEGEYTHREEERESTDLRRLGGEGSKPTIGSLWQRAHIAVAIEVGGTRLASSDKRRAKRRLTERKGPAPSLLQRVWRGERPQLADP